jgi:hypothetical protein
MLFVSRPNALEYITSLSPYPAYPYSGEYITYRITGAKPNTPIYWTSWLNNSLREDGSFYNQYTDAQGNWSAQVQAGREEENTGHWKKRAEVGGIFQEVEFNIKTWNYVWWNCHLGSVSKCLQIAKEKGSRAVRIAPPLSQEYQQT